MAYHATKAAKVFDDTLSTTPPEDERRIFLDTLSSANFAIHAEWDGNATATFSLWATNKFEANRTDLSDDDFVEDTAVSLPATGGAPGKWFIELGNSGARAYMLKVVTTGGTSNLKVFFNAKN